MQSSQPHNGAMDVNSLNFKSIVKTLEVVVKYESNQQKKAVCAHVLQKFMQQRNSSLLKELDKDNQLRLVQIRTMLKLYRNAFQKVTEKQQFKQFKIPDGKIAEHLLNLQEKIDPKDYKTSYLRAITLKKKQFNWTKEFIQDWMKTFDSEKQLEEEKSKQKQMQRNQLIKNQQLPQSLPPQNASNQHSQSIQNQNSLQQSTSVKIEEKKAIPKSSQKLPGQKPEKKIKKDENGEKQQKEKKAPKIKKQQEESQSSENEGGKQEKIQKQAKSKIARYEKPKEPKNRVKALVEYLMARKDLGSISSSSSKAKQIAEFINQNLEKFMKHHLSNLIQVAKLRNKKHQTLASSGNEFTYFSKDGYNPMKPINHLQVSQEPAKMLKLNYKSKFQMYAMLRTREQLLQEALLKEYGSKRDSQNNKTNDKRFWEYLLRPNNVVEKTQQYVQMQESKTDRLSIEIAHIRYLFQGHKYIRNSWLMMNCYNS